MPRHLDFSKQMLILKGAPRSLELVRGRHLLFFYDATSLALAIHWDRQPFQFVINAYHFRNNVRLLEEDNCVERRLPPGVISYQATFALEAN